MKLFKWSASYLIYVADLDREHQDVFRTADRLHRGLLEGTPLDELRADLDGILAHVGEHFINEERMMRAAHYLSLPWHKQQHDAARAKAATLARRIRRGDREAAVDLLQFLAPWLKDHICVADKMMAACLRNYQRARLAS